MSIVNTALKNDPLVKLIHEQPFVGWVYAIDYDTAFIMTNDLWKVEAKGIPHNSFLVAAAFNPEKYSEVQEQEGEVLLLRVVASAKLPQDDDLVRTKIDNRQDRQDVYGEERNFDELTLNQMQFGGLECRVLGTFYMRGGTLHLGSDLESFAVAANLRVYRPRDQALTTIVNHVDPVRKQNAEKEAQQLGLKKAINPFSIGTVRYTSTDRLHRHNNETLVKVSIQPFDFLARRTAVLGMTRTGKSNMIKQLVSVVKRVADEGQIKVGQIIYDINGEYANANQQDKGAIADVYPEDTVRYRMLPTDGFEDLRNNFFEQIQEGFNLIKRELELADGAKSSYIEAFVNMSLDEPDKKEFDEHARWRRRVAAYKVLLSLAEFKAPPNHIIQFPADKEICDAVNTRSSIPFPAANGKGELSLDVRQATEWFRIVHSINEQIAKRKSSSDNQQSDPQEDDDGNIPSNDTKKMKLPKKQWGDPSVQNLLNMIVQKQSGTFISGYRILSPSKRFHTPTRSAEVADEIYEHLKNGKVVILDLSVGDATMREKISKQIASRIFHGSMGTFIDGKTPPNIVVYIEEAHNLLGKGMDLTETWPRLAKEGAKYRIALVYATQEVSSVHPNILANTENWFVTHLNNEREINELARFYDFRDFSRSLMRAQDVGFARMKTLSSPFVIPVQIDLFNPESEKERVASKGMLL